MDIAAELQQEASDRAGSPEGFQQVIRLVLDDIERETGLPLYSHLPRDASGVCSRMEASDAHSGVAASQNQQTFYQYVGLMQKVLVYQQYVRELEHPLEHPHSWERIRTLVAPRRQVGILLEGEQHPSEIKHIRAQAQIQRNLNDATHAARKKARELPIHVFKRLRAFEICHAPKFGGWEKMYLPQNCGAIDECARRVADWSEET